MRIEREKARKAYITSTVSTYGVLRKYAERLTEDFGDKWWEVPMKGPLASDNLKQLREDIRAEKAALQALAEEKRKANPKYNIYKPWSDVLAYVKPKVDKGAGANAKRDIFKRLADDLPPIYKAVRLHDNADSDALMQVAHHIGHALIAAGVDLGPINEEVDAKLAGN